VERPEVDDPGQVIAAATERIAARPGDDAAHASAAGSA